MIKEPYIRIKTIDYSNLSDTVPDSLNVAMVINSDTGPTAVTKITDATQLIKYYSTKQQLNVTDDVTFKHAAKLLQFTPVYLTRAFDNSVLAGYTDGGDLIYTDLSYHTLPYRLEVKIPEPTLSGEIKFTQKVGNEVTISNASTYDKSLGTINGQTNAGRYFKVSKKDSWTLVSENDGIMSSSVSEVSNKYVNSWDWIRFSIGNSDITASDYIMINGTSFYPENKNLDTGSTTYPNVAVGIPVRTTENTTTMADGYHGLFDFQLGLLDKLISGEYGVSEAWGFTGGITTTGLKIDLDNTTDDIKLYISGTEADNGDEDDDTHDGLTSFKVYPNNVRFTATGSSKITIKASNHTYTLPYNAEESFADTSKVSTIYGLLEVIATNESSGVSISPESTNLFKIYVKDSDIDSYAINTQTWTDDHINKLSSAIESILPTQEDLSSKVEIDNFYIRIQDYVFYNKLISDTSIRNNPDIEQIKLSEGNLTYKQLLSKLRKAVGDVFNSTNTPNGFTLFWKSMPDRTKFGSDKAVTWNGKLLEDSTYFQSIKVSDLTSGSIVSLGTDGKITEINLSNDTTNPPKIRRGPYNSAPVVTITGGDGKAVLSAVLDPSTNNITAINVFNGGSSYSGSDYLRITPAVQITDNTQVESSAKFAVISRFPSKGSEGPLGFSYIRQDLEIEDGDPELYTFDLYYKDENIQSSTISFIEDKVDGSGVSVYFTYFNDINDFVQIIPLNGEINYKKYPNSNEQFKRMGNEIPVTEPEVDDYKSAADRFKTKDGTYYDFVFDGGYVHVGYAKHLMDMCKGGSEDSLWAMAMLSPVDDKDYLDRIKYRTETSIDNCNAQMMGDWVQDGTIADFLIDISPAAIVLEKIFANRAGGKEFACVFGPTNGAMQYKPKYPIINKDIREKLLNKQINTLIWDNSLQLSYFNLDLTMQSNDSSLSDCNNVRTINCIAHIADNYMKWFWGRVNDEATRNEVIQGLKYRIDQRCINNQQYHIDDYIIVCNETNNPVSVVENRQLVVDIKVKFRPGIRYINVFNKVYRLSQDFNSIG